MRYPEFNPKDALLFRITHRDNIPWILKHGLHCRSSGVQDPHFVQIGDPNIIDRRKTEPVGCAPGGMLSDYVPFYFTPFSPMFYNIYTGYRGVTRRDNEEIVIIVTSLDQFRKANLPLVFTDRHALVAVRRWFSDETDLDKIDWGLLQRRDFLRDLNDPGKVERYEVEALAHRHVPIDAVRAICCYDQPTVARLQRIAVNHQRIMPIKAWRKWYFGT